MNSSSGSVGISASQKPSADTRNLDCEPSSVKERPILFSAPMVRALLEGRKTQTRRVVTPAPVSVGYEPLISFNHGVAEWSFGPNDRDDRGLKWWRSPYGAPSDRLWVREAHYLTDDGDNEQVVYAEDKGAVEKHLDHVKRVATTYGLSDDWLRPHTKLRPSIHMPRWASRLTLQITDVRVERLNDISERDAKAEGIIEYEPTEEDPAEFAHIDGGEIWNNARSAFRDLWTNINGIASWNADPWVWVVAFEVAPKARRSTSQGSAEGAQGRAESAPKPTEQSSTHPHKGASS